MIGTVAAPAAWPEPIAQRAVITNKGRAVRAVYALVHQLADLDAAARQDVLHLLATEIRELPTTAWTDSSARRG